jgi:hypothetical protein
MAELPLQPLRRRLALDDARAVVSEATTKTHVARILQTLGLRDRIQAVIYAYETGIVSPGGN